MNQYIRQATSTDATAMHRVRLAVTENRLVSMALTEQDYVAATQQIGRGWVAEVDGEVVGFAVGMEKSDWSCGAPPTGSIRS